MKHAPQVGTSGEIRFIVQPEHTIDFSGQGMPAVLSTPSLLWFLEHAARDAVLPVVEPGESTVGVHVDVKHLAATPLGNEVTCRACVIHVDGPLISFQLEARDQQEMIARGHHKLRVIRVDRFAERVEHKRSLQ